MRTSTKTAVGVITLGVLGLSYQLGQSADITSGQFAAPVSNSTSTPSTVETPAASPSSSSSVAAAPNSSSTTSAAPKPRASSSSAASTVPAPKPSASQSQSQSQNTTGASATKSGSVIESGFGTVQVQVTMVSGKISDITMLQANATHGRAAAFPYLIQSAISANGASFANLSGATYTTNAFKQSLKDALAKL